VQAALRGLQPGARVLDASCGIGYDLASLTRRGFEAVGADASAAMAARARAQLVAVANSAPVVASTWADPPFRRAFDAVLCTGNSLAHCRSRPDRRRALAGLAGVLVTGGRLILDSQDWTALHTRGSHRDEDPQVLRRGGARARRVFEWDVPDGVHEVVTLTLTLLVEEEGTEQRTSTRVRFLPFDRDELRDDLVSVGLGDLEVTQVPGDDRYSVTAWAG
jgi:SAM-dependent methyltransferase